MAQPQRLSIPDVDPRAYEPLYALEQYVHSAGLDETLMALIKVRASQLNGCAFCLDMHAREGRKAGLDQRLLDVLPGWREALALYSDEQQAALALTEEVTLIGQGGVTDGVWNRAAEVFDERRLAALLMAISAINVWNRLAVATHQRLPEDGGS